ncbi:MAG TPA: hypothetical protein VFH11_07155 [Gemmatimonadota bacterium]|nr:hypothetical protein [Gemmatimonadota bacterium]
MNCKHWLRVMAALGVLAGCADDGPAGPAGPADKALEFSLSAPASIPRKQLVQLEVLVTRASSLTYPLTVRFEEANANQEFVLIATVLLQDPRETTAGIAEDAARDPLYRVTICDAGGAAQVCVERTAQVDDLDFP